MTDTVHVITDLGPTDGPGLIVPAQLRPHPVHLGGGISFGVDLDGGMSFGIGG